MGDFRIVDGRSSKDVPKKPQWVYSVFALSAGLVWSFGGLATRMAKHSDAWQYLIWRSLGVIVVIECLQLWRTRTANAPSSVDQLTVNSTSSVSDSIARHPSPAGHPSTQELPVVSRFMVVRAFTSGWLTVIACFALLAASLGFVYALKNTTAANAAFLGSLTPLIAVLLARVFLHEKLTLVTVVAMAIALGGLAIMVVSDIGVGNMRGNLSAVASAFGFATYTVCVRSNRQRDWAPVMPGYAAMLVVICSIVVLGNNKPLVPPLADVAWALLHGGLFIVFGTSLFNLASRHIQAVAMTVFAQTETVFVPFWIFLAFDETPKVATLIGGAMILAAVIGKAFVEARLAEPIPFPSPVADHPGTIA